MESCPSPPHPLGTSPHVDEFGGAEFALLVRKDASLAIAVRVQAVAQVQVGLISDVFLNQSTVKLATHGFARAALVLDGVCRSHHQGGGGEEDEKRARDARVDAEKRHRSVELNVCFARGKVVYRIAFGRYPYCTSICDFATLYK